jgi:drug/metabolite transporter (DMT)-like permease
VSAETITGLVLALASAVLINIAYLREHDAAAELPVLSMRRPLQSARLLLGDRSWLLGFAMESGGFLLYVAALILAPLSLVQSIAAGGIGVLAFASARLARRRLARRELLGVLLSVVGLAALAISLTGGKAKEGTGDIVPIVLWLGITAAVAILLVVVGRARYGAAVATGVAGGLFFSIGDIATKVTTQGGARAAFVVILLLGYFLGTALLQIGYQAGAALTVAGLATLVTNALPIAAGTVILDEPLPRGALGVVRALAFVAVVAGAVLLARPPAKES